MNDINISSIARTIEEQGQTFAEIKGRINELDSAIAQIEKKANRPRADGGRSEDTPARAEHRKAFDAYLRRGTDAGLVEAQRKAMNTTSDPDGGYLIMPEMDMAIDRVAETMGGLYAVANTVTTGTQKWQKLVKTSGMAMRRVANGGTGGETTEPRYSQVEIEVHPSEVEPWVHNETLADSRINLEADLADEAGTAFAEGGGAEFITGDGVGKARGILAYTNVANASYAWGSLGYVVTGASGAFATASTSVNSADSLIALQHALKAKYRAGAVWLMNSATAGVVRKLKDADGRHVWSDSLINGQPPILLGSPVQIDDNMPDVSAGAYAIAYGDFKRAYTIVSHAAGTTLIRDNVTTKGQTKFNFRRRFGGGVTHFEACKLLKFATS